MRPVMSVFDCRMIDVFPTSREPMRGFVDRMLTLEAIKADSALTEMIVCQRGSRLSITPVDPLHFKRVCKLAGFK